ncbi:tetratricopeptide repeat protein [Acidithiobacillus sp.]
MNHSHGVRNLRKGLAALGFLAAAGCATHQPSAPVAAEPVQKVSSSDLQGLNLQLIEKMEAEQKWYAAISYLDRYLKDYPPSASTDLLRARALAATERPEQAGRYFHRVLRTPLAAQGYQGLGLIAARNGDIAKAIQRFQQAVQEDPTDAGILNNLGYAALQGKAWGVARDALFRAGELAPQDERVWSNIALYYLLRGDTLKAQQIMGAHNFSWNVSQRIRQEADQMMGVSASTSDHPAAAAAAAAPSGAAIMPAFPNPPLTQLFSSSGNAGPATKPRSVP